MSALSTRKEVLATIIDTGVVAVIRMTDASRLHAVADALLDGGVRAIEVTMTVPNAVALIRELSTRITADVIIGAGTVLDADTADKVIDAGARFVVSPVFRPAIIEKCERRRVAVVPGCFTPTEIL